MILERTILQLDIGPMPLTEARQAAQLGYMQWLGSLPGHADYRHATRYALTKAKPFCESPAVAEFCKLLQESLDNPLQPLALCLPRRKRRGGADGRRTWRMPL
jgi:hypothetical protein